MSKAETIRHEGIIESLGAEGCTVRILQASACSSCSARQLCRSSESKEKLVEAGWQEWEDYIDGKSIIIPHPARLLDEYRIFMVM